MLLLEIYQLFIVLGYRGDYKIELLRVVFSHIFQVILKSAGIIGHSLHLEFNLGVDSDRLLISDHLLMAKVSQLSQLLRQLVSFRLGHF